MHNSEERRQQLTDQLKHLMSSGGEAPLSSFGGEESDVSELQEELNKIKDPRDVIEDIADLFDFDGAKDFLGVRMLLSNCSD